MIAEIAGDSAAVSLGGRAGEVAARNRGGRHTVVPLCDISDGVAAWAGYREDWGVQSDRRHVVFLEGSFTIHIGRVGEIDKPQIMRSEWASPHSRAFVEGAGHPHWQLDALETMRMRSLPPVRGFLRSRAPTTEFSAAPSDAIDLLRGLTVERMHLASATSWWRDPAQPIAHYPASVAELDRWVLGCLTYIRQEVARCDLPRMHARYER